jgi:hypothetical protein
MKLFDYYLLKNNSKSWVEEYQSTSSKKSGKTFSFYNTNFRTISSFYDIFTKFENYVNVPRNEWELTKVNQEKAKQWIVNLQQSKLYSKKDGYFTFSKKGMAYKNLINSNLNEDEKWIINLIFLIDSYFENKPNYLLYKVNYFNNKLLESKYQLSDFLDLLNQAIKKSKYSTTELFKLRIFWIITFYKDSDIHDFIQNATDEELENISKYIEIQRLKVNSNDCIGHKFKNSGQYNTNSFLDDMKILYFVNFIIQNNLLAFEFDYFVEALIFEYKKFRIVDKRKIIDFFKQEQDVFFEIFDDLRGVKSSIFDENEDFQVISNTPPIDLEIFNKEKNIRKVQIETYRRVSSILKKQAKELTSYNCYLKDLNNCRYFTSRQNSKNYLEIHHLIPIEFSNDFEISLDFVENYIPLCPHCHRLIHFGEDNERKSSLTFLFNKRIKLISNFIKDFNLEKLFSYYDVSI